MSKKRKSKFKPYQIFCAVEDEENREVFEQFASRTHAGFQVPKSQNLFEEISNSPAYCFFLDWNTYESIRKQLDEYYENEEIKPLIYLVGTMPFFGPSNLSDWIHIFAREDKTVILNDMNLVRSRIRT